MAAGQEKTIEQRSKAKETEKTEEKEEENCARDLSGSQGVLDDANAILAVGQRRCCNSDRRLSPYGYIRSAARRIDGRLQ